MSELQKPAMKSKETSYSI